MMIGGVFMIISLLTSFFLLASSPFCDVVNDFQEDLKYTTFIYDFIKKSSSEGDYASNVGALISIHKEMERLEEKYTELLNSTANKEEKKIIKRMQHFFYASKMIALYGVKFITSGNKNFQHSFLQKAEEAQEDLDDIAELTKGYHCTS